MQNTCFYKKISILFIACFSLMIFAQEVLTDDIGLRVYNGSETVSISVEPLGTLTSPLRIAKDGNIYGIVLIDPGDPNDSGVRIQTGSGIKALRKHVSLLTAYLYPSMWSMQTLNNWHTVFVEFTVTENNLSGLPIVGATVLGTWSGSYGGTVSGITNASGKVSFTAEWEGVYDWVTFTVNTITMGSNVYDLAGELSKSFSL